MECFKLAIKRHYIHGCLLFSSSFSFSICRYRGITRTKESKSIKNNLPSTCIHSVVSLGWYIVFYIVGPFCFSFFCLNSVDCSCRLLMRMQVYSLMFLFGCDLFNQMTKHTHLNGKESEREKRYV